MELTKERKITIPRTLMLLRSIKEKQEEKQASILMGTTSSKIIEALSMNLAGNSHSQGLCANDH